MSVRVRFAPSPTGYLHVGGARTALFNYLYAKKMGGQFVLRIEDTDLERSTEEALRMQISDLQWLGLTWDEGVDPESLVSHGDYGPYRQSERQEIYREHAAKLLDTGAAYYDFRSDEELEALKEKAIKEDNVYRAPRPDVIPTLEEARGRLAKGETAAVRFMVDHKQKFQVQDLVRGRVKFPSDMVGDFVILRSNGMPVYNFCCAIDDALMKITHVFRAEEHLNNTLRQQMIYQAFGYPCPEFAHLSLVLGKDKQKLSKRHGATSCNEYKERGFLSEAVTNYIALLGWSPKGDQEIFSRAELIDSFSVEGLNSSGAVFDEKKLEWMNAEHLRALSGEELFVLIKPVLNKVGLVLPEEKPGPWFESTIALFKPYMKTLQDAVELFKPLLEDEFEVLEEGKEALSWPSTKSVLEAWKSAVEKTSFPISSEGFDQIQNEIKSNCEVKGKFLFQPLRVAVIGKPSGAELKALVPALDKEKILKRVDICLAQTSS